MLVLVRLDGVVFQSYGSLNNVLIEKMFEGPETFVVGNDCVKRCDVHSEKKFVSAKKTKFAKNFKCVLAVLKVLTIGAIIFLNSWK